MKNEVNYLNKINNENNKIHINQIKKINQNNYLKEMHEWIKIFDKMEDFGDK